MDDEWKKSRQTRHKIRQWSIIKLSNGRSVHLYSRFYSVPDCDVVYMCLFAHNLMLVPWLD